MSGVAATKFLQDFKQRASCLAEKSCCIQVHLSSVRVKNLPEYV